MSPKATIKLPNGTTISIDGEPYEIARITAQIAGKPVQSAEKRSPKPIKKPKKGATLYIRELKADGFFKGGKPLEQIRDALEAKGFIYGLNELSPPVLRLRRSGELGRIKKDGMWVYTHRE